MSRLSSPTSIRQHPLLVRFLLLITVIVWGATFVATKVCLMYLSPAEVLALRLLVAMPVFYGLILVRRIRIAFSASEKRTVLLGSGVLTLHFLIQITGLQYTSATNTGWIIAITPLVLVLLSVLFLKERVGGREVAGILIATIGIVLLMSKGDLTSLGWLASPGDWLILASAHTWAVYTLVGRDISRRHNPIAVAFAFFLPGSLVMIGYMLATSDWNRFLHLPVEVVVGILFLGAVATVLANWWWQKGVAVLGAAKSGMFLYIEPLATTMLAVPLLHESFGIFTAIGGSLVVCGVYLAQRGK